VSAETCPHYLTFIADDCAGRDSAMKAFPPVRSWHDQEALWQGVNDGTIVSMGSDHAPHTPEDKSLEFSHAPAGMVAVETMVPVMLDRMCAGQITPERLSWLLSEGTARLYGLHPKKGALQPGADADMTLVDPTSEWTIRGEDLHSKQHHTPWEGTSLRGAPVISVLRGSVVMRDRQPVGDARGSLVTRGQTQDPATDHGGER
jgi:allantoinase